MCLSKDTRVQGWVNQEERSRGDGGQVMPDLEGHSKDFGFAVSDVVESSEQRWDTI